MIMFNDTCDPDNVEYMIEAATLALEESSLGSSPDEVVSAILTLLDRTLRAKRRLQPANERFTLAANVRDVLTDLITDHGKVPS
jgi:hypothetical protein